MTQTPAPSTAANREGATATVNQNTTIIPRDNVGGNGESVPIGHVHQVRSGATPPMRAPSWPDPLAPAALHGPAGDFVRIVAPHTEADPAALLLSFLVVFGNIIGHHAYFLAEADRHFSNLFAVIVGLTSKGRKGTSFGYIRDLFGQLDGSWAADRIRPGLSSGEGLIWAVRDPIIKQRPIVEHNRVVDYQEVQEDAGVADKRLVCVEGEFAGVLRVLEREGNTLSALIRCAWDTGSLSSMTKNSPARATDAHISMIGHITQNELLRYLSSTESGNGFGNRFLWVCSKRARILPEGGCLPEGTLTSVSDCIWRAMQFARNAGELRRDEDARALWYQVYPELSEGKPGLLGSLTSRAEAQVMRLALIYALLDCSPLIRLAHLQAGLAVWHYCAESTCYIFGDSLGNPLADDLLRLLRQTPDGMTRTEINNHFSRNRTAHEIDNAFRLLAEHGLVRCDMVATGGRPAERWFATSTNADRRGDERNEENEESRSVG